MLFHSRGHPFFLHARTVREPSVWLLMMCYGACEDKEGLASLGMHGVPSCELVVKHVPPSASTQLPVGLWVFIA